MSLVIKIYLGRMRITLLIAIMISLLLHCLLFIIFIIFNRHELNYREKRTKGIEVRLGTPDKNIGLKSHGSNNNTNLEDQNKNVKVQPEKITSNMVEPSGKQKAPYKTKQTGNLIKSQELDEKNIVELFLSKEVKFDQREKSVSELIKKEVNKNIDNLNLVNAFEELDTTNDETFSNVFDPKLREKLLETKKIRKKPNFIPDTFSVGGARFYSLGGGLCLREAISYVVDIDMQSSNLLTSNVSTTPCSNTKSESEKMIEGIRNALDRKK